MDSWKIKTLKSDKRLASCTERINRLKKAINIINFSNIHMTDVSDEELNLIRSARHLRRVRRQTRDRTEVICKEYGSNSEKITLRLIDEFPHHDIYAVWVRLNIIARKINEYISDNLTPTPAQDAPPSA